MIEVLGFAIVWTSHGLKKINNKTFYICASIVLFVTLLERYKSIRDVGDVMWSLVVVFFYSVVLYITVKFFQLLISIIVSRSNLRSTAFINPVLRTFEEGRIKSMISKLYFYFYITTAPLVLVGVNFMLVAGMPSSAIVYIYIIGGCFFLRSYMAKSKNMNRYFKQYVVTEALEKEFTDVTYNTDGRFGTPEIMELRLFEARSFVRGNDMITAKRNNREFTYCDIKVFEEDGEEVTGRGEGFNGCVIKFEIQESVGSMFIISDGFPHLNSALTKFEKALGRYNKEKTETESFLFNQRFDTYCNTENSKIALTPYIIDKMTSLSEVIKEKMALVFHGRYVYLFVENSINDRFDVDFNSDASTETQFFKIQREVAYIATLIDETPIF